MKIKMVKTEGSTLVMTLFISGVMGITLAAYLNLVGNRNLATMRSLAWNSTMPAIEAGLEEALTQCHFNYRDTNLSANGWSSYDGNFRKTRTIGDKYYEVTISADRPPIITSRGYAMLPLQTNYISRTVRINTRADFVFSKAMTVQGGIDLNGNNVISDSFDSEDPDHSDNGLYPAGIGKRKDNGDIATVSGITGVIAGGNANVYGHAATGPGGSMSLGSNGGVGSRTWQNSNDGIQPGWFTDDMNVDFPDVTLPFSPPGAPVLPGIVGGTNYDYVLGSGNYQMISLNMAGNSTMIVTNDAVLYITGNASLSGNAQIDIAPGGHLTIYMGGANADFSGNGIINETGSAFNFAYFGLPSNTSVSFAGNASWAGTVYAPEAQITTVGNGDFVGSIVGGSVRMTGNGGFHYDEALGRRGMFRGILVTTWNEI